MDQEKTLLEQLAGQLMNRKPQVLESALLGNAGVEILDNGSIYYCFRGQRIRSFFSRGQTADGNVIDSRTAKNLGTERHPLQDSLGEGTALRTAFRENGLVLYRDVVLRPGGELTISVTLAKARGGRVTTRYLAPVDTPYPDDTGKSLFLSLDQKMLLTPYDNDMWARYESSVPQPGRQSYDVTAIYDDNTLEGLVIGALDFDIWKNAIAWKAHDARSVTAYSGAADGGSHDVMPHGTVTGQEVSSARFTLFWSEDIRDGMEHYGDLCALVTPKRPWSGGPIFGWNSYSALGLGLRLSHWQEAGEFLHREVPAFADDQGVSYINLDGAFGLNHREIRRIVEDLHARGQKAGWYAAPCCCIPVLGKLPVPGTLTPLEQLILKDDHDRPMPAADGSFPLDVTHPLWEQYARAQIRNVLDLGFDYIKLDFLSHAGVEGCHHLRQYTGRMALNHAYSVLADEIGKADREIFVSLSIAPLFPYFLGNGRRCCCDSFGHREDVRYVLNALNFGWWTNDRLYRYNDPDHLALYHSVIDGRGITSQEEARSRYLSGVISGTMMILSDNYGPEGDPERIAAARSRTASLAGNAGLNAIARLGKAFRPVFLGDGTCPCYTLSWDGKHYAAVFNFREEAQDMYFPAARGRLPESGSAVSLITGERFDYSGDFRLTLPAGGSDLFQVVEA